VAVTAPAAIAASCSFEEPAKDDRIERAGPLGARVFVDSNTVREDGAYALVVHLHAGDAARKVTAAPRLDAVLATIDRGPTSSHYAELVASRRAWDDLVAGIDRAVADHIGRPARAERVIVSSFSAGYAGVDAILARASDDPALVGLVLLDSLYAGYGPSGPPVTRAEVVRFDAFARRALEPSRRSFALTHSEVATTGYASTREVADLFVRELALRDDPVAATATDGLAPTRLASEQGVTVRGYAGSSAAAHCAHLRLLPELVMRALDR
jgi:hypothetical protein